MNFIVSNYLWYWRPGCAQLSTDALQSISILYNYIPPN